MGTVQISARIDKALKQAIEEYCKTRGIVMHGPFWGWVNDTKDKWTELANGAGVDLVIAGHHHRLSRINPGERGNEYTILVVGQDQVATVEATATTLRVAVTDKDGTQADSFVLTPK